MMTFDPSKLSEDALSDWLLDYARGRLTAEEASKAETMVAGDPKLAEEVAYYRGLASAMSATRAPKTKDEMGWARLSKAIASEPAALSNAPSAANDNQPFWKFAAAALAMVAVLQTAFLVQSNSAGDEPVYVTASADRANNFALDIVFSADATAQEITQNLRAVDAEVFEGPSAIGLYSVRFETEIARDEALQQLRLEADIVESVTIK